MAKRKWNYKMLRHPRTTQERKENINNPFVRGKRRRLPNAWDDIFIRPQKSWKYLGRKHQYREEKHNYEWHEFKYEYHERRLAIQLADFLSRLGCFHEWTGGGIRWYGPAWILKGRCPRCYSKLITDNLSQLYGNWCSNEECSYIQEKTKWLT